MNINKNVNFTFLQMILFMSSCMMHFKIILKPLIEVSKHINNIILTIILN